MTDTTNFTCYEVEDDEGNHIGYWRSRERAYELAERLCGYVRDLDPPDFIACEDDDDADGAAVTMAHGAGLH